MSSDLPLVFFQYQERTQIEVFVLVLALVVKAMELLKFIATLFLQLHFLVFKRLIKGAKKCGKKAATKL